MPFQFQDTEHVYECKVPGFEDTDLVVGLKVVPPRDFDKLKGEFRGLNFEGITDKTNELIISKVAFVKGYVLPDGTELKTGKELYERGLPDIWKFVQESVFEAKILSQAEIKNS